MLSVQPVQSPVAQPRGRWGEAFDALLGGVVLLVVAASWVTHVVACLAQGLWGLLLLGVVACPVAVVHGLAIWAAAWL